MIVADANLVAYLVIRGPMTALAESALGRDADWRLPPLWRSEVRNVLLKYVRQKTISSSQAIVAMQRAENMFVPGEAAVDSAHVLNLATISGCSAYDCEYVALAESLGVMVVSADRPLAQKFPGRVVPLADFVRG